MLHTGLFVYNASCHSPVYGETGLFANGLAYWQFGRTDLVSADPLIVSALKTGPAALAGVRLPEHTADQRGLYAEYQMFEALLAKNGRSAIRWVSVARLSGLGFSLVGAYACYRWAKSLNGTGAALGALCLWCFSGLVIGHGPLLTPDIAAATMSVVAAGAVWWWMATPTVPRAFVAAGACGVMLATKIDTLTLPLIWSIFAIGPIWKLVRQTPRGYLRAAAQVAILVVGPCYTINLLYGFEGTLTPLGRYDFQSRAMFAAPGFTAPTGMKQSEPGTLARQLDATTRWDWRMLPCPLPASYVWSVDARLHELEWPTLAFLHGSWRLGGWWYYYLASFAAKESSGVILLCGVLTLTWAFVRRFTVPAVFLLASACGPFALQAAFSKSDQHLRHVLPAIPFLYILLSFSLSTTGRVAVRRIATGCVLAAIVEGWWHFPHSLASFNLLHGGGHHGQNYLRNSSDLDWGQDLILLQQWTEAHPEARPLTICYSGSFNSERIGGWGTDIEFVPDVPGVDRLTPGYYAIFKRKLYRPPREDDPMATFAQRVPTARVGYTVCIYQIEGAGR